MPVEGAKTRLTSDYFRLSISPVVWLISNAARVSASFSTVSVNVKGESKLNVTVGLCGVERSRVLNSSIPDAASMQTTVSSYAAVVV